MRFCEAIGVKAGRVDWDYLSAMAAKSTAVNRFDIPEKMGRAA